MSKYMPIAYTGYRILYTGFGTIINYVQSRYTLNKLHSQVTTFHLPNIFAGKVCERRKLVPKWEIQSSYPLRENIWEFLYESNGENFKCHSKRRNRKVSKQRGDNYNRGKTKLILLIVLLMILGIAGYFWKTNNYLETNDFMKKLLRIAGTTHLPSGEWQHSSVTEECYFKMRYLELKLLRTENALRNTLRIRSNMLMSQVKVIKRNSIDGRYIEGATATKGSNTQEWGGRVALWGVVPLWRAAPPPHTVLAVRNPTPADCWPFSGTSGELVFQLPRSQIIRGISVEHIRPDLANSAPKRFVVQSILTNNTLIKLTENEYHQTGPPKQYYLLNIKTPINNIIFRVLTNHGNLKYTCIYRVHLYGYANFNNNL